MLARQVNPGKVQEFMRSYEDATSRPHGYLMLDLKPTSSSSSSSIMSNSASHFGGRNGFTGGGANSFPGGAIAPPPRYIVKKGTAVSNINIYSTENSLPRKNEA